MAVVRRILLSGGLQIWLASQGVSKALLEKNLTPIERLDGFLEY